MEKTELLKLRLDGLTYEQIGLRAGISRQRVQQLLSPPFSIRKFIVEKYQGKCSRCGIYVGKSGHVHHNGDNPETYNDIENLELLCLGCHRKAHNPEITKGAKEYARTKYTEAPSRPITGIMLTCQRCGHTWLRRNLEHLPAQCPHCKNAYWNALRKERKND